MYFWYVLFSNHATHTAVKSGSLLTVKRQQEPHSWPKGKDTFEQFAIQRDLDKLNK